MIVRRQKEMNERTYNPIFGMWFFAESTDSDSDPPVPEPEDEF